MTRYSFLTDPERFIFQLFQNNLVTLQQLVESNIGNELLYDFWMSHNNVNDPEYILYMNKLKHMIRYELDTELSGLFTVEIHNKRAFFKMSGKLENLTTDLFNVIHTHPYHKGEYGWSLFHAMDDMGKTLWNSRTTVDKGHSMIERHTMFIFDKVSSKSNSTLFDSNYKKCLHDKFNSIVL